MNVRDVLPRDAIPSVDDPTFEPVADADGDPDDRVVVYEGDGDVRAYPVRYLDFHEVVNDTVDRPVAVTWCPLCGAVVVYDRRVADRTLTFGVSGKLADDDLVLYDRETESEWKQSAGRAIAGPLEGTTLAVLPASMTTLGRFRESNPEGRVLRPPGGESEAASDDDSPALIDYERTPYADYEESDGFGLDAHRGGTGRDWDRTDLEPKTPVLGLTDGDDALGFPRVRVLEAGGVATATVGDRDVVVVATPTGTHAYVDPGYDWRVLTGDDSATEPAGVTRLSADGTTWDPTTGRAEDGRSLERLPARRLFAFTWQDDHRPDAFWQV
jgi:hypothetical protein